jgi:RNA polymerase sigma-70 factor (ECF subfamily)
MPASSNGRSEVLSRALGDVPDAEQTLRLLDRVRDGDRRALEELLARFQSRLHRIVRIQLAGSTLRRGLDSMDIVQSTFEAALPRFADLRPRSSAGLLEWLATVALNKIRDAYDYQAALKRDVVREQPIEDCGPGAQRALELPPGRESDPAETSLLAEVRDLLDAEVAQLPEDQREVVLRRDYYGEEWERIADALCRGQHASQQLYQRAWIRLRERLRPKLESCE